MSGASRERLRAVLHGLHADADADLAMACLLVAADFMPDLDEATIGRWLEVLDTLAATVPTGGDPAQRLRSALGHFGGDARVYDDLRSSLLPEVLLRRRGLPILLSVVWVEVARRAGVPAWGLGLPGHYVVGVGDPGGDYRLLDPFAGGAPVRAPRLPGPGPVQPWGTLATLARVLANIRFWAERADRARVHLRAVELTLLLPSHPAGLRRERGRLMVRCGDYLGGARELEAYAAGLGGADGRAAAEATAALREARMARAGMN